MAVNAAEILACLADREEDDRDDDEEDDENEEDEEAVTVPNVRDWSKFNPKLGKDKKYMNTGTTPKNVTLLLSFT
jgi:hypothetical protein